MSIIQRPGYSDRFKRTDKRFALAFPDQQNFLQSSELNEMQSIADDKLRRVADYILQDGRLMSGDDPVVAPVGTVGNQVRVTLPAGSIYIGGLVHDVAQRVFTVSTTASLTLGVRLVETLVTEENDVDLRGKLPGSESHMEPGAARIKYECFWAHSADGLSGAIVPVFQMIGGAILTSETNIDYSEIYNAIASYSRESNGSYVFSGCLVRPLGLDAQARQSFTVSEGVAYVNGRRLPRQQSLRFNMKEEPDLREIAAEPHVFDVDPSQQKPIRLSRSPIAQVTRVLVIKEKVETVTHGAFSGVTDPLENPAVERIISVSQGGVNFTTPASWLLSQGAIDWSPTGPEPSPGTQYTVHYRYYENVEPVSIDRDTIVVTGAVTGTNVLIDYRYKLPRTDILAMEPGGTLVYVKGTSATARPRSPSVPSGHLELAKIYNRWDMAPDVVQSATRNVPYSEIESMKNMMLDLYDLVAQERLKNDASANEVASKRGVFVDPFLDDAMRDQGIAQTAAVFGGRCMLPIHGRPHEFPAFVNVAHLPFTQEVAFSQLRESGSMKINPYATFTALPGMATLEPSSDMWTESETVWSSPETQAFQAEAGEAITGIELSQSIELVRTTTRAAETIRQREINFRLEGFYETETIAELRFDGLNVDAIGAAPANAEGVITGRFMIPAGVPAGVKAVTFVGSAGTRCGTSYTGRGTITVEERRLSSALSTSTEVMPQPINPPAIINNITNVTNNVTNVTNVTEVNNATRVGRVIGRGDLDDRGDSNGGYSDPLAQSFVFLQSRCLAAVRLKCAVRGNVSNGVLVQIRTSIAGLPSQTTLAEAFVSGSTLQPGQFFTANFRLPVYLTAGTEYWFVVLTDDAEHALAIAELGKLDQTGSPIAEQPFIVGVMATSSNASTWTVHNEMDAVFELLVCRFEPVEHTVLLGTFQATKMSDIIVSAGVEYPEPFVDVEILLKRPNGQIVRSAAAQTIQLDEYWTNETIEVSAVLRGTRELTPFLFPDVQIIEGELQQTADYVSRASEAGDDTAAASVTFDAMLPAGSTVNVEIGVPGDFVQVSVSGARQLGNGLVEQRYRRTPYQPQDARTHITLTGSPAARPHISSLRLITTDVI